MVSRAESGEGRDPGGGGAGGKCGGRRSEAGGAAPPGRSPTSRRAACRARTCSGGARWTTRRPEVEGVQPFSLPCWFGLRHFGYGGAATLASRPSPFLLLLVPWQGMRVGAKRAGPGPAAGLGGGSGLPPGALPMEMAPDGPGLPPQPPFLRSLGRATWRDCR